MYTLHVLYNICTMHTKVHSDVSPTIEVSALSLELLPNSLSLFAIPSALLCNVQYIKLYTYMYVYVHVHVS